MPVFYHSVLLPDMIDMMKKKKKTLPFLVLNTIWQNRHSAWEMPFLKIWNANKKFRDFILSGMKKLKVVLNLFVSIN